MSKNNDSGKFWPYMILGFFAIGVTLGVWTVKSTISMPVHESNAYMKKYQDAEKNAVEIEESEAKFDSKYNLLLNGLEKSNFKPKNLKRKAHAYYSLSENNTFEYKVTTKDGKAVEDANLTLLVTRPQTEKDDIAYGQIKSAGNGVYRVQNLKIAKPGRYILRLKATVNGDTKYLDSYGFKSK